MSYRSDLHTGRIMVSRAELTETFDDGDFQLVHALGHADESFHKIGRNQPFGFSSHAPPGAIGHVLSVGGRRDAAWALGLEHPEHRPRNVPRGESVLYNAHGDVIYVHKKHIKITTETFEVVATDIVLNGTVALGGPKGSGKLVHRKDDVDSDGDAAVGSATKVTAV